MILITVMGTILLITMMMMMIMIIVVMMTIMMISYFIQLWITDRNFLFAMLSSFRPF